MNNVPATPKPLIYTLTMLSCIGGFLFGYDTGIISGALVQISDQFNLTDWEKELVVSITVAGACMTCARIIYFVIFKIVNSGCSCHFRTM